MAESSAVTVDELILELSLASNQPIGAGNRNLYIATAAANSIYGRIKDMDVKQLRTYEWTVPPLLEVLIIDADHPLTTKAALVLRGLMPSRICISRLIECQGLKYIAQVLDILLARNLSDMKVPCTPRSIVENLVVCYREVARYYPWDVVNARAIRHGVLLLKYGDVTIQTIIATTFASLSSDYEICKQLFSYGAIKPLLNVSDGDNTNEACMLAGLGCLIQLCRIPEIGVRMVTQGAIRLLEKGILRQVGHGSLAIREKCLYSLCYLSQYKTVRNKICTPITLEGIYNEYWRGTIAAKESIMQLLMNCVGQYEGEKEFVDKLKDSLITILKEGPWNSKNLVIKTICVLYREDSDRMYMLENGVVEAIFDVINAKSTDLQEAPIVCLLHLCVHPEIPFAMIQKGAEKVAASFLDADDPIIKELSIILLKALLLYDNEAVEAVVSEDKQYLLLRDVYNPQVFGAEYGGMIQDYLQTIVENRRDQNYLIKMFSKQEIEDLNCTMEELESFELTFMQLDIDCAGTLDVDELKLLMVLMGEEMDKEELKELLDEYDTDKSGNLDFKEFVVMMKGWNDRFGQGLTRIYNLWIKRGAIGNARRAWKKWMERDKIEAAEVQLAKAKRLNARSEAKGLEVSFLSHEKMKVKRELEQQLRDKGYSKSPNYPRVMPKEHSDSIRLPSIRGSSRASSGRDFSVGSSKKSW